MLTKHLKHSGIALSVCLSLSACQPGNGDGLNERGVPLGLDTSPSNDVGEGGSDDSSSDESSSEVTLARIQNEIFSPICSDCHQGAGAPQGLRLDSEENSFNFLVSQTANERSDLLRVNPGNPEQSYIVLKIEGDPSIIGGRMPLGLPALLDEQIGLIRDWISQGAAREGEGNRATSVSLVKANSDGLEIRFSRKIDSDLLGDSSIAFAQLVSKQSNSGESVFGESGVSIQLDDAQQTLRLRSNQSSSTPYEVSFNANSLIPIYDQNGSIVDGDGDGWEGGEFSYRWRQNADDSANNTKTNRFNKYTNSVRGEAHD